MFKKAIEKNKNFLYLCVKSNLEELQGHNVVPVISHKLDLFLLSSLQGHSVQIIKII